MNQGPVLPPVSRRPPRSLPADAARFTPGGLLGDWQATFEAFGEALRVTRHFGHRNGPAARPSEPESALVEFYRNTTHRPYLDLAVRLLYNRSHGRLDPGEFGSDHCQDQVPLRQATTVTRHRDEPYGDIPLDH
ncbi:hypothetical protein ACQP2E_11855 [Actinoplanes sp. CA-015351]|uniref:hypothetical protein n=1 Tax=Actinoplanes sp. CA-015351 TaxID=3239897 RepID=UPI003D963B52